MPIAFVEHDLGIDWNDANDVPAMVCKKFCKILFLTWSKDSTSQVLVTAERMQQGMVVTNHPNCSE